METFGIERSEFILRNIFLPCNCEETNSSNVFAIVNISNSKKAITLHTKSWTIGTVYNHAATTNQQIWRQ